jgi:hypothetical protein
VFLPGKRERVLKPEPCIRPTPYALRPPVPITSAPQKYHPGPSPEHVAGGLELKLLVTPTPRSTPYALRPMPYALYMSSVVPTPSLDKLEGLLSPRADVKPPGRGPRSLTVEKGLRASQIGTD